MEKPRYLRNIEECRLPAREWLPVDITLLSKEEPTPEEAPYCTKHTFSLKLCTDVVAQNTASSSDKHSLKERAMKQLKGYVYREVRDEMRWLIEELGNLQQCCSESGKNRIQHLIGELWEDIKMLEG